MQSQKIDRPIVVHSQQTSAPQHALCWERVWNQEETEGVIATGHREKRGLPYMWQVTICNM